MVIKTMSDYCKEKFGTKVYRLSLSSGCSCPNRDGKLGVGGCTFCSEHGSGEFASRNQDILIQLEEAKKKVAQKFPKSIQKEAQKFIAYFQSFTSTYGNPKRLLPLFQKVMDQEEIVCLAIGTRPDCLEKEMLDGLERLNQQKPVWIELGLQTIHEESAKRFHRGYDLSVFEKAYQELKKRKIEVIVHMILGFPWESKQDIYASMDYLARLRPRLDGIKLHGLHLVRGTALAKEYEAHPFPLWSLEEYGDVLMECLKRLPTETIIHRFTGDGDKKTLIEPIWSMDKKRVLNYLNQRIKEEERE